MKRLSAGLDHANPCGATSSPCVTMFACWHAVAIGVALRDAPADKLIRCATAPTSAGCSFKPPPDNFDVRYDMGPAGNVTVRVQTAWHSG